MLYIGNFYSLVRGSTSIFQMFVIDISAENARIKFKNKLLSTNNPVLEDINKIYLDYILEINIDTFGEKAQILNFNNMVSIEEEEDDDENEFYVIDDCRILISSLATPNNTSELSSVKKYTYHGDVELKREEFTNPVNNPPSYMEKILEDKNKNGEFPFVVLKSIIDE
jgi:hypothetical protein